PRRGRRRRARAGRAAGTSGGPAGTDGAPDRGEAAGCGRRPATRRRAGRAARRQRPAGLGGGRGPAPPAGGDQHPVADPPPPTPLDEVRAVMSVFAEALSTLVPALSRELDLALAGEAAGVEPPSFRPFLRWGSWVGGDRDGNPHVTAEVTQSAMAIQSEHVL